MKGTAHSNPETRGDNSYETNYVKPMQDRDGTTIQYARPLDERIALLITLKDADNMYAWNKKKYSSLCSQ